MQLIYLLLPVLATLSSAQTVYLIRHGEKPSDGGDGLSAQGVQRSQCLRNVFGASSGYDIGSIHFSHDVESGTDAKRYIGGARERPLETVQPLANDLGLSVDTSCDRDDQKCVAKLVQKYGDSGAAGNILICWEHDNLTPIVKALGDKNAPDYPDDSFNIIWTDPSPYKTITSETSEMCPGLDD